MRKILTLCLLLACLCGCAAGTQRPQYDRPVIALLDTGISTAAIDSAALLPGHNYVTDTADTEDRMNHGTAVASVILGCASADVAGLAADACLVVPLVVADADGSVPPETLAQAIRDSIDRYGADIVNISLGIRQDHDALREAVAYAEKCGVLVVSAVGNEGDSDALYYPAAYETVLAVGSHDKHLRVSDFTQRSGAADLLAPGEDIWLASANGKTYGARGTSYATGYVSAAAARLWHAQPELDAAALRRALLDSAATADGWRILNLDSP